MKLRIRTQFTLCVLLLMLGMLLEGLATKSAFMVSNQTTVAQMDNTDVATLGVKTIHNGEGLVKVLVWVPILLVGAFVITRKQPSEKES